LSVRLGDTNIRGEITVQADTRVPGPATVN